jgi:hypothetical protein
MMSTKWTIGVIIAVLAAMFALPGIASADHHAVVTAETACDGTFAIDADYFGSGISANVFITYNGNNYDDGLNEGVDGDAGDIPDDMTATRDDSHYNAVGGPDYFDFAANEDDEDFFTLDGTYDSVVNAGSAVTVAADVTNGGVDDSATVSSDGDWDKCIIDYCQAGDSDGGTDFSFKATPDNNCDPVRLCVDGESVTVTEFDAESLDGEKGSCTPTSDPVITTVSTEPAPTPVEELEQVVAEVSPATDEVVALPSAGLGDPSGGANFGLIGLLAVTVVGFGGTTALMVRARK